jgi:hypothetical protein
MISAAKDLSFEFLQAERSRRDSGLAEGEQASGLNPN